MDNQEVIEKLSDLYIIQRGHYLIQNPEPIGYRQYKAGEIKNGKKVKSLMDWQIQKHLQGEFTIGTFGGKIMSKFMTFDIDFNNNLGTAKWITYKVSSALDELGIHCYYISFSGNKGYHIDLFFEDLIEIKHAKQFFKYVIVKSGVLPFFDESNKVEFRVTDKKGIKLPLGIHQKTKNYCGFCKIEDGLTVMDRQASNEYLSSIIKLQRIDVLEIIGETNIVEIDKVKFVKTEDAISPHRPLAKYDPTEDDIINKAMDYLTNGLKIQGSRHNALVMIAKFLKYSGCEESYCKDELYNWMEEQDENTYATPLKQCYEDIDSIVKWVYEHECLLKPREKDISVTLEEIKQIIEKCPDKNQKLITYAMLIHSKRYATQQGVFYMVYKDIQEATGLYDQAIQHQVNKLIELGVIEIVARNRKQTGTKKKLPNKYKLNIVGQSTSNNEEMFVTDKLNDITSCMKFYLSEKELKKMLPRRQYENFMIG